LNGAETVKTSTEVAARQADEGFKAPIETGEGFSETHGAFNPPVETLNDSKGNQLDEPSQRFSGNQGNGSMTARLRADRGGKSVEDQPRGKRKTKWRGKFDDHQTRR
jgi:hypothetical protein